MSKIIRPFIKFFKFIYRIIDKLIVTPVSRIVYKIGEFYRDNSNKLEKILNRPNILIYVSLLSAFAIFWLVDSRVINLTDHSAEVLEDQKINVNYSEGLYVVEGVPESVDITLIGNKTNIYLATQLGDHEVVLDLTKYGVGTYKVPLKYNHSINYIDYKLDPSTVTVKISEKVSNSKNLYYDLLNEDKLDAKLSIANVELSEQKAVVKSSKEILEKVAVVKALIDTSLIDLKESGNTTLENVELAAYDSSGNRLKNIEIVPATVNATITIDSYHATKPVKVIINDKMSNGKAVSSANPSTKEVVVYGEKSIVDKLAYVEAPIYVSKLESDKTLSVNLNQPAGIRFMSETTTNVSVAIGNASQRVIESVPIKSVNVGVDYVAQASSKGNVDVIITGVDTIINQIDIANISATVDCSGLGRGTHEIDIKVDVLNELVTAEPATKKISVKIS